MNSPTPNRLSLRTYVEPRPKPSDTQNKQINIFVVVVIILLSCLFFNFFNASSQTKEQSQGADEGKNASGVVQNPIQPLNFAPFFSEKENFFSIEELIGSEQSNSEPAHQLSIRNYHQNEDAIYESMEKICCVSVVKHKRMTSPISRSRSLVGLLESFLFPDPYQAVEAIFEQDNQNIWRSEGKILTVFANNFIQLSLIKIQAIIQEPRPLYLVGISAYDTVVTLEKSLESVVLQKLTVRPGVNYLQCRRPLCDRKYSMIAICLDPMEVKSIEMFTRKIV